MMLFSLLMVMVAWRMLRREREQEGPSDHGHASWGQKNCMLNEQTGRFDWTAKCTATLAALGAVTGVVSGLLGVGGGFLIVPAFKQLTDEGFYTKAPYKGREKALASLTASEVGPLTRGFRLGGMIQQRAEWVSEVQAALAGDKTMQEALDTAVERSNAILAKFAKTYIGKTLP